MNHLRINKLKNSLFQLLFVVPFGLVGALFFSLDCWMLISDDVDAGFLFCAVFIGMGLLFMGIALGYVIYHRKKAQKRAYLKRNGVCLQAKITGIDVDKSESMNGRHPVRVTCSHPANNGGTYSFVSHAVWHGFNNLADKQTVPVYVDHKNYDNYFVDVDAIVLEE